MKWSNKVVSMSAIGPKRTWASAYFGLDAFRILNIPAAQEVLAEPSILLPQAVLNPHFRSAKIAEIFAAWAQMQFCAAPLSANGGKADIVRTLCSDVTRLIRTGASVHLMPASPAATPPARIIDPAQRR